MDDWDEEIGDALEGAGDKAGEFQQQMEALRKVFADVGLDAKSLAGTFSGGLKAGLKDALRGGDRLSDMLRGFAGTVSNKAFHSAVDPVTDHLGGALAKGLSGLVGAILPFADGAAFSQGRVMPFASGGVVSGPTHFPMRGGVGLMGEAGPEAIMPLARGPDGRLGVRGQGGDVRVVMNISTPDVEGFRRSEGQIAAQLGRVINRGQRNR